MEQLAQLLSAHVADHRLAHAPQLHAAWQMVRTAGTPCTTLEAAALREYLAPLSPNGNDEHLQSTVAEHLWHVLSVEDAAEPPLVRIIGPKAFTTGPGADGLTVRRDGSLVFTLWEIKKHVGLHLTGVIAGAYTQLSDRAARYLTELAATEQVTADPVEARMFARLVEAWIAGEPHMRVGIAVATTTERQRCFSTMRRHFGHLTSPDPCAGLLVVLADFPAFARRVGEVIWTGL